MASLVMTGMGADAKFTGLKAGCLAWELDRRIDGSWTAIIKAYRHAADEVELGDIGEIELMEALGRIFIGQAKVVRIIENVMREDLDRLQYEFEGVFPLIVKKKGVTDG